MAYIATRLVMHPEHDSYKESKYNAGTEATIYRSASSGTVSVAKASLGEEGMLEEEATIEVSSEETNRSGKL